MAAETATVSIDDLFKPRLEEQTVEIDGLGRFKIRAMSRHELVTLRGKGLPFVEIEQHMISTALLDPKLTVAQVKKWQEASAAGEIEELSNAILRISKMGKGADKEVMKNFREEP